MLQLLDDIRLYASLLPIWKVLASGALLGADKFAARFFPRISSALDSVPKTVRTPFEVLVLFCALLWAGFYVWRMEHQQATVLITDQKDFTDTHSKSTCDQRIPQGVLQNYFQLSRKNFKGALPYVTIYTDEGRKQNCLLALDFSTALTNSGWPKNLFIVREDRLTGSGLIFHAGATEQALSMYRALYDFYPLKFDQDENKQANWQFWINDRPPRTVTDFVKQP